MHFFINALAAIVALAILFATLTVGASLFQKFERGSSSSVPSSDGKLTLPKTLPSSEESA